jgi:hypothetical protein
MQQYKDSFNYSGLFQSATSEAIQKKEEEDRREQKNKMYGLSVW